MWTVAALYEFVSLPDCRERVAALRAFGEAHGLVGTLIFAEEGVNGTFAGSEDAVHQALALLQADGVIARLNLKFSRAEKRPFRQWKVKVKPEIVTFRQNGFDVARDGGTYVDPADWNELIRDPSVTLVDTRNSYEVGVGKFAGAIDPGLDSFPEFVDYVRNHLDPEKTPRVATYCTGGIRCEKATAFLRQEGFREVFQLKGGILQYLADVPKDQSLWEGDCFVFDWRLAVDHDLQPAGYHLCPVCDAPVKEPCRCEHVL